MQECILSRFAACLSVALALTLPAFAQAPPGVPPGGPPAPSIPPSLGPRDGLPSVEEVTKDLKRLDGLFTIYYADQNDRKDPEKLLALIPGRLMNQDLLLATSLSQGGFFTSWMWADYLIQFQVRGKQLAIMLPEVRYPGSREDPVSDVIQRTYKARILSTMPILALSPGGEPVIDLSSLLKSNLAGLPSGGGIRSDLSKWVRRGPGGAPAKVFPNNILIEVELAVGSGQGASLIGVAYAFRDLPPLGSYTPRPADDRVGYFLTARRDWTKRHDARETFERFLNRWNLQKRDPSLELSPPIQPITFYIEKTVPVQWRRWVRQGIEVWNKAFEKIGFTEAIQILQQTNDNEYKDHDPEDARYNFFRWIVSGSPFAMGPSRTDPRTGQILDADIVFDDSMVREWIQDFTTFTPRRIAEAKGPGFREFLKRHPHYRVPGGDLPSAGGPDPGEAEMIRNTIETKFAERGQGFCDYSIGFQHQIALGYFALALRSQSVKIPERLIGEAIREVVAHEVGHALGLRHNFKASSWLSLEEVERRRASEEPTSASVMDYNPMLFLPHDSTDGKGHFITPTIGPYDYWAIEYGYKVRGPGDRSEEEMLAGIASRCAEPGLAYATDEDTMWVYSPDPLADRFDMSSDSFRWAAERVTLVDSLLSLVGDIAISPGESRYFVTRAFEALLWEKGTVLDGVARWVGGQHFHRDHRGDPSGRPPFVLVPAEKQRAALKALKESLFSDGFFSFSPELLNQLAPPRWYHWGATTSLRLDYPIHHRIRLLQWWTLTDILSPPILQRIYDAELKSTEADKFTAAELMATIQDHVWAALEKGPPAAEHSDSRPYISSVTRSLQREHLELVLEGVLSPVHWPVTPDVHAIICGSARDLSARIARVTGTNLNFLDRASRAHLVECRSRLDRALEAHFQRQG